MKRMRPIAPERAAGFAPKTPWAVEPLGEDMTTLSPSPSQAASFPSYKSILSKVDEATHKQMKRLGLGENVPVGDLQIEALNLLFRSWGLPEIAVRVTPDESRRRS